LWAYGSSLQEGLNWEVSVSVLVLYTNSIRRFPGRRVCLWISYLILPLPTQQQSIAPVPMEKVLMQFDILLHHDKNCMSTDFYWLDAPSLPSVE
jgi:hypothetical protein